MYIRHSLRVVKSITPFFLSFFLLAACSSGGGGDSDQDNAKATISRIEISPTTVLLTDLGDTKQLKAQAYNANGDPVDSNIIWTTNDPATVSVNDSGQVSAEDFSGSALLIAEADGIKSPPTLAVVAMPALNTVLVSDDQVVEGPQLDLPDEEVDIGSTYKVVITNPVVQVGDKLLGTGEFPIAGSVVDVVDQGNANQLVTVELIPLNQLFTNLVIDEEFDLKDIPYEIPAQVADLYNVEQQDDGSYLFTPKAGAVAIAGAINTVHVFRSATSATGTTALGPFQCDVPITATLPVSFPGVLPTFTLTQSIQFILNYDSNTSSLRKLAIKGSAGAEAKIKTVLEAAITAKLECKAELFVLPLPVGGPLAFFFGGQVPLGASFDVGGKVNLLQLGFEIFSKANATAEAGLQCSETGDCSVIGTVDATSSSDYKLIAPNNPNVSSQLQFEPSFGGAAYAELAIGPRFFRNLRLSAFEIKFGPRQAANLSFVENQINDTTYASDYKLTLDTVVGTTASFDRLLRVLSLQAAKFELKGTVPISTSPKSLKVEADVASYQTGDTVTFKVDLDPSTVTYLGGYNVDKLSLYRKITLPGGGSGAELLTTLTAATGQTTFSMTWIADRDGIIGENFYAFVTTVLSLPFLSPTITELELGKAVNTTSCIPGEPLPQTHPPIDNSLFIGNWDGAVPVLCDVEDACAGSLGEEGDAPFGGVIGLKVTLQPGANPNEYTGSAVSVLVPGDIAWIADDIGSENAYIYDVNGTIMPIDEGGAVNLVVSATSGTAYARAEEFYLPIVQQSFTINGSMDVICTEEGVRSLRLSGDHSWQGSYEILSDL